MLYKSQLYSPYHHTYLPCHGYYKSKYRAMHRFENFSDAKGLYSITTYDDTERWIKTEFYRIKERKVNYLSLADEITTRLRMDFKMGKALHENSKIKKEDNEL